MALPLEWAARPELFSRWTREAFRIYGHAESNDLHFFKYPRLGAFYAVLMKVKTYLSEKAFDSNISKIEAHKKATEEFNKEHEERETKFR